MALKFIGGSFCVIISDVEESMSAAGLISVWNGFRKLFLK